MVANTINQKILNFDKLKDIIHQRKLLFPDSDIKLHLQDDKVGSTSKFIKTNIEEMKEHIISISKNFPQRKCVVAHKFLDHTIILEVHPIVESA